jgi:hypothetical protein
VNLCEQEPEAGLLRAFISGPEHRVVGAGQLVRSAGLWTLGVVCVALFGAAIARQTERRAALRALVVVGVVGVLVALPWYVFLQTRYSNPIFGRTSAPSTTIVAPGLVPGRSAAPAPFRLVAAAPLPSRMLWFYVDPGLPGLLALAGLAVARVRARAELLVVPLMALAALGGTLYYVHAYPTVDGDTVKALFILPAVPAFAMCFGFAVETIGRRSRWLAVVLAVPLTVCLLVSLAFGIA